MAYELLTDCVWNRMGMPHGYQPVMLITILWGGTTLTHAATWQTELLVNDLR